MISKFLISLILLLLFPTSASAHMIGQPPYFKANGVFTDYYPVPSSSLEDFDLPQDIVSQPVLLNQSVNFEIDENALPVPKDIVEKTKFEWDFGDGSEKASGLKNSHIYTKMGTYILTIHVDSGEGFEPQLLQTTAVNVIPDKNYQLPKAVIEINGKQSKDPLVDILDVNFSSFLNFNGSKSSPGSSQITSYFWDLGDQNSKSEATFKYQYKENPYTVFPLLRVKTKDGFFADSFVQIKDEKAFEESSVKPLIQIPGVKSDSGSNFWIIAAAAISLVIAVGLIFVVVKFFRK